MKAGEVYYGKNPGKISTYVKVEILAVEGEQAAIRRELVGGGLELSVRYTSGLKQILSESYQTTPWNLEPEEGDIITFPWQDYGVKHYVIERKHVNDNPRFPAKEVQWVALRVYHDDTTQLCIVNIDGKFEKIGSRNV